MILEIKIKLGELQQIDVETFEFALKEIIQLEESESIHFVPKIAHVYVRCPKCKSPDFKVIRGLGVSFLSL